MIALLVGAIVWWWWPAPARERVARTDEVVAAPEEEQEARPRPKENAPEPEQASSKLPEDPLETGSCALELSLYDADSGAALKGKVRLYRLDVPGNEHYERGDQLQVVVAVPLEGATVKQLPEGWYRPHCTTQRYPGPDLDPFLVSGSVTRQSLPAAMPRVYAAWLIVRDETGSEIDVGTLRGSRRTHSGRSQDPAWFKERKLRHPDRFILIGGGWGGARGGSRRRRAVAEDGRYSLGRYPEDVWDRHVKVGWTWSADGRTDVLVRLDLERWKESTFVGVSVPLEWVHRAVLMPDGGRAIDAGAKFKAWCPAVSDDSDLVVHVNVAMAGYEDLEFEFVPNDSIPTRTLTIKRTVPDPPR
ncbi:MAG: hypothetical protein ACYS0E_20045 [Planctomycetota bacterium]